MNLGMSQRLGHIRVEQGLGLVLEKSIMRMVKQFLITIQELLKQGVKHFQESQKQWQISGQEIGDNNLRVERRKKHERFNKTRA